MVEVEFFDPGSLPPGLIADHAANSHLLSLEDHLPSEQTRNDSTIFSRSSTFLMQIESQARQRGSRLFVAREEGRHVATSLAKVSKVTSIDHEDIQLSDSHARHRLAPGVPPLSLGSSYELAIDPASNLILKALKQEPLVEPVEPIARYCINPFVDLQSVSQNEADAFFSRARSQPHIAFQYPANGCWARAHEMCYLIERHFDRKPQDVAAKIWNFGDLKVKTRNNPYCEVSWNYHVAPLIKVGVQLMVIDPSLFEQPVDIHKWRCAQADLSVDPVFTSKDAYDWDGKKSHDGFSSDEDRTKTANHLWYYWGVLISMIYNSGPLPYLCENSRPVDAKNASEISV